MKIDIYSPEDYQNFVIAHPDVFEEHTVYIDDVPKYIIGLFQTGDIWSEDEQWGTMVVYLDEQISDSKSIYKDEYGTVCFDFYPEPDIRKFVELYILNKECKIEFYQPIFKERIQLITDNGTNRRY